MGTHAASRAEVRAQGRPVGLRSDIQGLRAIAVGLVVLYHLWPNRLPGGFVGVDVFFVISGFLITGHLLRDIERSGRVRLGRFWLRRIRRLIPSALLVLIVTAVAVLVVVPQQFWRQFLREAAASALYVQNWALADSSVDYLAADNVPSPVQHYWSLSVEEQFYFGMPILLLLVTLVVRGARRRAALVTTLVVLTAASLAWSIHLTAVNPASAYFVTPTRLWELGLGALVAVAPALTRRGARIALSTAGIVAVVLAAFVIDGATPFPGYAALLPVLGTAAVIWAGATHARLEPLRLLATRPFQWVGDYSYAIYLWHWPLIVLLPFALDVDELSRTHRIGILVATAALSWLSARYVENPVRFGTVPRLTQARVILPATVVGMALVVGMAVGGITTLDRQQQRSDRLVAQVLDDDPSCFGAAAYVGDGEPDCVNPDLEGRLVPPPVDVADDFGRDDRCWTGVEKSQLRVCSYGPADADVRIWAVGDSHNAALDPAWKAMADRNGWRVESSSKNVCYLTTAPQPKETQADVDACEEWKKQVRERLRTEQYDAVVVTHGANNRPPDAGSEAASEDLIVDGMREDWEPVLDAGTPIIALRDNPRPQSSTIDCVAQAGLDANEKCGISADFGLGPFDGSKEAADGLDGVTYLDFSRLYCPADTCRTVIGNVVVYRDTEGHITGTLARTLEPRISAAVEQAIS